MTREEFITALDLLIARGDLTTEDAQTLIALYDAGQLAPGALWLPADQATATTEDDNEAALGIALALTLAGPYSEDTVAQIIDRLQDEAEARIAELSPTAAAGQIAEWHEEMAGMIARLTLAGLYAAGQATPEALQQAQDEISEQLRWLYLFAAAAAANAALGRPWSPAYLTARSRLYLGMARARFYRQIEANAAYSDGWVIDYIAVDDPATCDPCSDAESAGPYLPGAGPMPGQVCEGGGNCRCRRVARYDPETAALLRARAAA